MKDGWNDALIFTHNALMNIERVPYLEVALFHDESFDPTIHYELDLDTFKKKFPDIDLKQTLNDLLLIGNIKNQYSMITFIPDNKKKLWELIYNLRGSMLDENIEQRSELERLLTYVARDTHFDVWSHNEYNRSFLNNEGKRFVFTVFIRPALFYPWKDVRFSSAGFKHSLLYTLWAKEYDVQWEEDKEMKKYLIEPELKELNVMFYTATRNWSRTFYETEIAGTKKKIADDYYETVGQALLDCGIKKTLCSLNKHDQRTFSGVECEPLPFISSGLNNFSHHKTLTVRSAFNKPKAYYDFMRWRGLEKEAKAEDIERIYQNLYRTGMRVPGSSVDGWTLIIPSLLLFPKYMQERFKKVNFIKIGNFDDDALPKSGRPKGSTKVDPSIAARRQHIHEFKSRIRSEFRLQKQGIEPDESRKIVFTIFDAPTEFDEDGKPEYFPNLGDRHEDSPEMFVAILKKKALSKPQNKYANLSFSLVDYEDNKRIHAKAKQVHGAVFDFDTDIEQGFVTYERVQALFGDVNCFFYTSYSGGFKRRLVMLFKESLTAGEAEMLIEHMHNQFLEAYPHCQSDRKCYCFAQSWFFPSKETLIEHHAGELFDAREYLNGNVGIGLSVEQYDNLYKMSPAKLVNNSDYGSRGYQKHQYRVQVLPIIDQMGPHHRYDLALSAAGKVIRYCPDFKDDLIRDLKTKGASNSLQKDIKHFIEEHINS